MTNSWCKVFDLSYPECKMCGQCCVCACPSVSLKEMMKRSAEGDGFARDFFSIFLPHKNIEDAKKTNESVVNRTIEVIKKDNINIPIEELVFYKCKYLDNNNKCLVHEDRPDLCRSYPDIPYVVFPAGCAYENWASVCKEKHKSLNKEIKEIKELRKQIENLKYQQKVFETVCQLRFINNEYKFSFLIPSMSIVSPAKSWIKIL